MRIASALVLVAALLSPNAFAAAKKDAKPAKSSGKTAAPAAGKKKANTRADLEAAKAGVKAFAPWDATFKSVTDKIGAPTKIEGTQNLWYVKEGDKCVELLMDKMNDSVGTTGISEYDKAMAAQYAKCDAK
jgi:hypothetical protein